MAFAFIETKVAEPMFHLSLFRMRAFAAGTIASLLTSIARGGLQFMLIIWLLLLSGLGQGMFSAPTTSAIMGSVQPTERGVASGMRATFQNAGTSLSIGVFFSLMIAGLANSLPHTLASGLTAQGVPAPVAAQVAGLPPVSTLFAAFLGSNPIQHLLGPSGVLPTLSPAHSATLTGHEFVPNLIAGPFHHGLVVVFTAATVMALLAAAASGLRGRHQPAAGPARDLAAASGQVLSRSGGRSEAEAKRWSGNAAGA